ncbi:endonuclease/exonuclease/phosphatase family metal-dependent hydrolase [Kineococcus xinjiangensis]|uniref:Endonuclease/exonuclease/phosphatase family metal-dependent hydrolase n=1 Tax=Kineococcus xinjiangensis TaxID=512762 RepID=A0A2S6IWL8_9ACTN|nr:endonuclease/exonuclease/phosphatase family protein [Kineococcus xinjiangensis]PPK98759.1 endonuclease/exonuclease/phosphatase family metal-dependent hydrolase [Kineococcus xinjiangensis]
MPEQPLRLVSWNAASGRGRDGVVRPGALAEAAASLRADVLALQEVDSAQPRSGGVDQVAEAAARCAHGGGAWSWRFARALLGTPGRRGGFVPATGGAGETGPSYGVGLLTPHPVTAWHEFRMPAGRGVLPLPLPPGAPQRVMLVPDEPRVAVAAVVETPRGTLTVVCTHLSFVPTRASVQLLALRQWARSLPAPRVLLGDLNLPGRLPAALTGWQRLAAQRTFPAPFPRVQFDHALGEELPLPVRGSAAVDLPVSDHRALVVELG